MEAQFSKLLAHANEDIKIIHSLRNSSGKKLGGTNHSKKTIGGGRNHKGGHYKGWYSPPQKFKHKPLQQHESIHDVYHRERAKFKGKLEDFDDYFQKHIG